MRGGMTGARQLTNFRKKQSRNLVQNRESPAATQLSLDKAERLEYNDGANLKSKDTGVQCRRDGELSAGRKPQGGNPTAAVRILHPASSG